jgi:hypothetical protein
VKIEYHRVPETNSLIILFKWEQILKLVEVSFVLIDDVNDDILSSIRYNMERNWDKFVESIIANAGTGILSGQLERISLFIRKMLY